MTHKQMQAELTRLAQARNLLVFTWPDPRLTPAGWVDTVILGPRGGLLIELKTHGAARSPRQNKVARYMLAAHWPYRLWYPAAFPQPVTRDLDAIA